MLKTAEDQIAYIDHLVLSFRAGRDIEGDLKSLQDALRLQHELKQAGSGWRKSQGIVAMITETGKAMVTVPCFRHESFGGLFVHKAEGGGNSRWNVTHDKSGLRIAGASTLNKTCKCVRDYLSGIDWDKDEAELVFTSNPDYPKIEAALKGLRESGLR